MSATHTIIAEEHGEAWVHCSASKSPHFSADFSLNQDGDEATCPTCKQRVGLKFVLELVEGGV